MVFDAVGSREFGVCSFDVCYLVLILVCYVFGVVVSVCLCIVCLLLSYCVDFGLCGGC